LTRLFSLLMLAFAGVLLLSTLARTVTLSFSLRQTYRSVSVRSAMEDARQIATWASERWERTPDEMRPSLATLARVAGARVWIVDRSGRVRVDTGSNPSWEGSLIAVDELQQALAGASVIRDRSPWLEAAVAAVAPVSRTGRIEGAVFLFIPSAGASIQEQWGSSLLWSAVVALALAAAAAYLLARFLSRPVEAITRFARRLEEGEFGGSIRVRAFAEVSQLAETLTRVSGHLKQSFEQVTEERRRLESILQSMHEGVILVSPAGEATLINEAGYRLLNWRTVPRLPALLLELPIPTRLRHALLGATRGETVEVHLRPRGRDDLLVVCIPLPASGGKSGAVAVIRDLSATMRLQRLRENFIADVAHELRGPLANLTVLTEALEDGTIQWEERQPYIGALRNEVTRLGRLARDVLDLARIDAGVLEVDLRSIEIAPVATTVVWRLDARAAEAGVVLLSEVPSGLTVTASPDRLEQVVYNLVENALRHTPPGGRVVIGALPEGNRVRISVSDNGSGIPAEHLPHIFERFYKADPARTRTDAGTGLGLSVVKQLVELQGGSVEASSEETKGSVFSVILPVA
jgi:two-component system, OmpR family, sensor histidine kinase ResE